MVHHLFSYLSLRREEGVHKSEVSFWLQSLRIEMSELWSVVFTTVSSPFGLYQTHIEAQGALGVLLYLTNI